MAVKRFSPDGEREVLAKTAAKQIALRRKKRARFRRQLRRRRPSLPQRDPLLRRGAWPERGRPRFRVAEDWLARKRRRGHAGSPYLSHRQERLQEAQLRDGPFLLPTNLVAEEPSAVL